MSVDTNTTGKDLTPYVRVRHPRHTVLVSPVVIGKVTELRVVARGRFVKRLAVELSAEPHRPSYADPGCC